MDVNGHTEAEARWFKLYLAVAKEGRDVMAEVTKALYAGGVMRPDVYLKEKCEYTDKEYKERFMPLQQAAIIEWPKDKPFNIKEAVKNPKWDITFHNALQQTTCNLIDNSRNNGTLDNYLSRLRDLRNQLCHTVPELSKGQLMQKKVKLIDLSRQILTALGKKTNISYEKEMEDVHRKLHQRFLPTTDMSGDTGEQNFKKEDQDFDLQYVDSAKVELLKQYEQKRNIDPGGLKPDKPLRIHSIYAISTMAVSKRDSKRESPAQIQANKILTLFRSGKSKTNVVITGAPGLGKTMLMLYILDNWCSETSSMTGIEDIDLILYIDMESLPTASLNILVKEHLLKKSFHNLGHKKALKKLQQWRTLWLLDGFDGSTESNSIAKDICDKFPHVIISANSEYISKLLSWTIKNTIIVELDSIDMITAKDICSNILLNLCRGRESKNRLEKFMEFLTRVEALQPGLIKSPFLVSRLCLLWLKNHVTFESIETVGQLNQELLKISIDQVSERLVHKTSETKAILQRKMLKLMDVLSKIAWELINENSTFLNERQVTQLFSTCKLLKLHDFYLIIIAPFLVKIQSAPNGFKVHRQAYKFFEQHNVDFLAARHVFSIMKKDGKVPLYSILENDQRWSNVGVNFVGIAAAENALESTLSKQVVDYMRGMDYETEDWMNLLRESRGNIHLSREITSIVEESLDQMVTFERMMKNWRMVSSLFHYWQLEVIELRIETEPDNLEVAIARMIILSHYVREMEIFCNWSLYALQSSEVVDDLLNHLTSNVRCVLSTFSGHLSDNAIRNGLPETVKSLSLRLTNHNQAVALHHWLQRHPIEEIKLILDFSQSVILDTLPCLTPRWLYPTYGVPSADKGVVILRRDYDQIKWEVKVLGKLTGNRYHLEAYDNADSESFSMPDFATDDDDDDNHGSSHQQNTSKRSNIRQSRVKQRKYAFYKYKPNRVRKTQFRCKLKDSRNITTKANVCSCDMSVPWSSFKVYKPLEEKLYLVLRLMLFFAVWNTFIVHNEGIDTPGYIGLLLALLLYFIPDETNIECRNGEAVDIYV